ncbi:hypothetical protein [Pedobacter gandavensis]|uniref:hypothetical protein n=1 Tax=Pedobacter gandavensis TaxID=2679963 RepID=UPI00292CDA39|nr:hypothetical protein [Pedobacter gandavensis]
MQKTEKFELHLEVDPNKLDSNIKSFEYNGNHYLYVCHIDKYSDKVGGHPDDRPDQVKLLVKSFYGKYLNLDVPLNELNTATFNDQLIKSIDQHLISIEPSY